MSDEVFAVTDEWLHPIRNTPAGERQHATDGAPCWCKPTVESVEYAQSPRVPAPVIAHAPLQRTPLTSSDEETETVLLAPAHRWPPTSSDGRMHVMNENCWCLPSVLAEGQGDDFRILEIDHRGQIVVGDRVAVDDAALADLRRIMRDATGAEPPPNNEGVVDQVWARDGQVTYVINFDDGGAAPYPAGETRRIA